MDAITEELNKIFRATFPGATIELDRMPGNDRLGGYVIWEGFEGVEPIDRQRQVHQLIKERVGADYRGKVTTIFAITPSEDLAMKEG